MIIVPKGKKVYFGARKFIEGDVLPPHVDIDFPEIAKRQAYSEIVDEERPGRGRKPKSSN